jgi:hypothetical protein
VFGDFTLRVPASAVIKLRMIQQEFQLRVNQLVAMNGMKHHEAVKSLGTQMLDSFAAVLGLVEIANAGEQNMYGNPLCDDVALRSDRLMSLQCLQHCRILFPTIHSIRDYNNVRICFRQLKALGIERTSLQRPVNCPYWSVHRLCTRRSLYRGSVHGP